MSIKFLVFCFVLFFCCFLLLLLLLFFRGHLHVLDTMSSLHFIQQALRKKNEIHLGMIMLNLAYNLFHYPNHPLSQIKCTFHSPNSYY